MGAKKLYTVWDHEKPLGEHNCQEWEELLSIPRQSIRDYAREGRVYRGRYTFKAVQEDDVGEKVLQEDPKITAQDLAEFKRSLKIGARFVHETFRKDFVKGSRVTVEKVAVAQKFPHIVKLVGIENPKHEVTMTYMELLRQKRARAKKRMLTSGR